MIYFYTFMASIPAAAAPDKVLRAMQCNNMIPKNLKALFPFKCSGLSNCS